MRFLIVDDSAVDRHLLKSLLQELGHDVDECTEPGDPALEQIRSGQYSAVFLDIVMPNQDGYKFLRSLRSNTETAKQKVIFCSSKKTQLEIDYGLKRAGADNYITKPVDRDSLTQALQRI